MVTVLGATGSVGRTTISLLKENRESFNIQALTAGNNWNYLPARLTKLNQNLGFNKLLINNNDDDPDDRAEAYWISTNSPETNANPNYIVNIDNMGRVQGQNSSTGSISQMIGVIPNAELLTSDFSNDRHYKAPYALPVNLNAVSNEKINNFNIYITRDDGKPAENLEHPSNFLLRIT